MSALAAIQWDIDPVAIKLGSLEFRYYGILFAAGLMSGYSILRWQFHEEGEDPDRAVQLTYGLIAGVIIGARLGHVFFYEAERYLANPVEIIKFWKGGLASHGATIGLIVAALIYAYFVRKFPFRVIADRMALAIPLATSCVRLGNFFNSEIVGRVTDVPWAVVFLRYDDQPRHPSQFYEVMIGLTLLAVMFLINRHYKNAGKERPLGLMLSLFLAGYFSMRFGVEFFKEYQTLEASTTLTMGQYLSIPFAAAGFLGIWASLAGPWKNQHASQFQKPVDLVANAESAAPEADAKDTKGSKNSEDSAESQKKRKGDAQKAETQAEKKKRRKKSR